MNIGIVGAGFIVKEFLKASQGIEEIKTIALLSREASLEKNKLLCHDYDIKKIYTDFKAMLKDSTIDTIYVAVPNHLHYDYSRIALENHKHVICEKPFTITLEQAKDLKALAEENKVMVFEAISTVHLQNYHHIKKLIDANSLGKIKIVTCNFSKISSRYADFKLGKILPAFDSKMYGGALMDLNCYNFHFILKLFGPPLSLKYLPNIEKGIDTSGIAIFEYLNFKCIATAAKDSNGHSGIEIQGDMKTLYVDSPSSLIESFSITDANFKTDTFNKNRYDNRIVNTFMEIHKIISSQNYVYYEQLLDHTISVVDLLETTRLT